MSEPISAIAASALGAILKPVIKDIYDLAKSKLTQAPSKAALISQSNAALSKQAYKVVLVKTLWNVEKEVSLFTFYYPSRLQAEKGAKVEGVINEFSDLPKFPRIIVEGTAGQGKSIFLRYLYGALALKSNEAGLLPLFIELRRVSEKLTLAASIVNALRVFGIDTSEAELKAFLETGKIVLLLDAFDELDASLVDRTIAEIEDLALAAEEMRIIITSRPASAIQHSSSFRVCKLDPLRVRDHQPFLNKVCGNSAQAKEINIAIQSPQVSSLRELLTTPLLMTLLVLLYRSQSSLPTTKTRFYEQLFDVMFFKHDQTKPGFRRARFTSLDELELKKLFEAFCFHAKLENTQIFSSNNLSKTLESAIETTGIVVGVPAFQKELTKTACLLIEEGLEVSFIHKSVAEYYTAAFIQRSSTEFAQNIYSQIIKEELQTPWNAELGYLEQIDTYRYYKYFLESQISEIIEALGISKTLDAKLAVSGEFYQSLMGACTFTFRSTKGRWNLDSIADANYTANIFRVPLVIPIFTGVINHFNDSEKSEEKFKEVVNGLDGDVTLTISRLVELTNDKILDGFKDQFVMNVQKILDKRVEMKDSISREEGKRKLIPLIKRR